MGCAHHYADRGWEKLHGPRVLKSRGMTRGRFGQMEEDRTVDLELWLEADRAGWFEDISVHLPSSSESQCKADWKTSAEGVFLAET